MASLDIKKELPIDVNVFLGNIGTLMDLVVGEDDTPKDLAEYEELGHFPVFDAESDLTIYTGTVSDKALHDAPQLNTPIPSGKRKAEPESESEDDFAMPVTKKPGGKPAEKKVKVGDGTGVPATKQETPAPKGKLNTKGSYSLRDTNPVPYRDQAGSEDADEEQEEEQEEKKGALKSKQETQLQKLLPQVEECLRAILSKKGDTFRVIQSAGNQSFLITIVRKQGNKTYSPTSTLTPGPSNERAPIPKILHADHFKLPIGEAIMPEWSCSKCIIWMVECHSDGLGVECMNFTKKKIGHLCEHGLNASCFMHLVSNFRDTVAITEPNAGTIDLLFLHKQADRIIVQQSLVDKLREELAEQLRSFLISIHKQNRLLGTQGFKAFSTPTAGPEVLEDFNTLITAFNKTLEFRNKSAHHDDVPPSSPRAVSNDDDIRSFAADSGDEYSSGDDTKGSPENGFPTRPVKKESKPKSQGDTEGGEDAAA
ncbi:hypothetical protein B0H14DRAFT_3459028 [Mycena olivaceomarginata]|nr:hypothetical protein B0H14DRAFT_3459028 [Mycena olivaceomarginata]